MENNSLTRELLVEILPKPYDKEPYDKWIEIQSKFYFEIPRALAEFPHVLIRLHTYSYPEQLLNNIEYPQVERIVTSDPREFLLLLYRYKSLLRWKQ